MKLITPAVIAKEKENLSGGVERFLSLYIVFGRLRPCHRDFYETLFF